MTRIALLLLTLALAAPAAADVQILRTADVDWQHLNPARGDKSPSAGTLWGDRNGTGPTGFLLRPTDGFESPPHIHNVSYRAVVIRGLIHNDDPDAADMWLPAGSFWTQPKGEVHITAARGTDSLAYVEIEAGPYLVLPSDEAFDSGERPINVDESNLVWVSAEDVAWMDASTKTDGPEVAYLWGEPKDGSLHGLFLRLPAGYSGSIHSGGSTFRAVVIQGRPLHGAAPEAPLEPGSGFRSAGETEHRIASDADAATILYLRTDGALETR